MNMNTWNTGFNRLSGGRKAAILLVTLGPEVSSQVYKSLSDYEIEQITLEIAGLNDIPKEQIAEIMEEFYHTVMARQYINQGGVTTAQEILEKALGSDKAQEILNRLQGLVGNKPFHHLKNITPENLVQILQHEYPQTIALILTYLPPDQAAAAMSLLPPDTQYEIAQRIATMDQTSPEVIYDVEKWIEQKLTTFAAQQLSIAGGVNQLAEVLNRTEQGTTKSILAGIENENPLLANEIKKQMFTFDDLLYLSDRDIQKILREVDMRELVIALKGAGEPVKAQIMHNVSSRVAQNIQEELELIGPTRLKKVEESQQQIMAIVRRLVESGDIIIERFSNGEYLE